MSTGDYISIGIVLFNILLGLIAFFGGMVIKGLSQSVKDLQSADTQFIKDISQFVKRDDLKEIKEEQRQLFKELFDKLDKLKDDLHNKVDRSEFTDTGSYRGVCPK